VEGGCGGICSSTGTQVFGPVANSHWQFALAEFRADFASPTEFVSIDFVGVDDGDVKAEIYDLNGVLLDSFIASLGGEGENAIATFTRSTADIAYILAGGVPGEGVSLDNLVVSVPDTAVPTPATLPLFATGLGLMALLAWRRKRLALRKGGIMKSLFLATANASGARRLLITTALTLASPAMADVIGLNQSFGPASGVPPSAAASLIAAWAR
jgi:hypothetical protein